MKFTFRLISIVLCVICSWDCFAGADAARDDGPVSAPALKKPQDLRSERIINNLNNNINALNQSRDAINQNIQNIGSVIQEQIGQTAAVPATQPQVSGQQPQPQVDNQSPQPQVYEQPQVQIYQQPQGQVYYNQQPQAQLYNQQPQPPVEAPYAPEQLGTLDSSGVEKSDPGLAALAQDPGIAEGNQINESPVKPADYGNQIWDTPVDNDNDEVHEVDFNKPNLSYDSKLGYGFVQDGMETVKQIGSRIIQWGNNLFGNGSAADAATGNQHSDQNPDEVEQNLQDFKSDLNDERKAAGQKITLKNVRSTTEAGEKAVEQGVNGSVNAGATQLQQTP